MNCTCDFILPTQNGWNKHYDNCKTIWKHDKYEYPKNKDGSMQLPNKHLSKLDCDILYHLGFDTVKHDLPAMFGDIKHGIGIPSMTVVLEEVLKMLFYAKAKDPIFFRLGTSGGMGIPAGSVVISSWAMNGTLEKIYDLPILGKTKTFPAIFDQRLNQELYSIACHEDYNTYVGGTMTANDFYRGEGRTDGAFCDYTESDKMDFLQTLVGLGVKNLEMEATAFSAITKEAGLRAAELCITFLDRLLGDQVTPDGQTLSQWQKRPAIIVGKYIEAYYNTKK
ncbi:uridine phosphorylase 1-like isoform X3 [Pieris napi]|uniref:uridine phosphorylase 1-like isoform X3 n=1 Tax=Pieris napi TaxID=78633 RepID=UPI001FBA0DA3|nr:uridine phosphorylase 1-like isoform X3 [Pieris napi]